MTDFVEMFRHWHAGRHEVQIQDTLGIDRKSIRKYVAPALAERLKPAPGDPFDERLWRARIVRWFPGCGPDPAGADLGADRCASRVRLRHINAAVMT